MKEQKVSDIVVVGNCSDPCCTDDIAGTTIQLQQGEDTIVIALSDISEVTQAMLSVSSP